jgi:hypothetical protein
VWTRFRLAAGTARAIALLLVAILAGIALLACVIAALIWSPRCRPGDRIAIAETLLLGGCGDGRRLRPSRD